MVAHHAIRCTFVEPTGSSCTVRSSPVTLIGVDRAQRVRDDGWGAHQCKDLVETMIYKDSTNPGKALSKGRLAGKGEVVKWAKVSGDKD
jgi:hypothetical protein